MELQAYAFLGTCSSYIYLIYFGMLNGNGDFKVNLGILQLYHLLKCCRESSVHIKWWNRSPFKITMELPISYERLISIYLLHIYDWRNEYCLVLNTTLCTVPEFSKLIMNQFLTLLKLIDGHQGILTTHKLSIVHNSQNKLWGAAEFPKQIMRLAPNKMMFVKTKFSQIRNESNRINI